MRMTQHEHHTAGLRFVRLLARFSMVLGLVAGLILFSGGPPAHAAGSQIGDCTFGTLQTDIQAGGDWYYAAGQCSSPITFTDRIVVANNASLTAKGDDITVTGGGNQQLFFVKSTATFSLSGLTLSRGFGSSDTLGAQSCLPNCGGAIFNQGGTVNVSDSTFSSNTAGKGGAIYNGYAWCGPCGTGTLTISDSTFSGNNNGPGGIGGAIFTVGTVTISDSTFSGNSNGRSGGVGGAINNGGTGVTTISNSTLTGNTAGAGGAVYNASGATLTITDSTLSGNSATDGPGAIDNSHSSDALTPSSAGVQGSILAGGGQQCSGTITDHGYNLASDGSCLNGGTGDVSGDPKLAPLANYGGPTQTLALLSGSPAIGASKSCSFTGPGGATVTTDQRGFVRLPSSTSSSCDIGAFDTAGVPAVSGLAAQAHDGQVTLSWDSFSIPASQYTVALIGGPGSVGSIACTVLTPCTTTVSSLTNGTTYTFEVLITTPVPGGDGTQGGAAAQVTATPKGLATLSLGNLTQTYDGTPRGVTVTTSPADLTEVSVTYAGTGGTTYDSSTTPPTNAGSYSVSASLTNATYAAAPATGTLTVAKAQTKTSVTSSAHPSAYGQSITFTASVSVQSPGGGTPAGTVQFAIDGTDVGSPVALSGDGSATSGAISSLSVASHSVTAVYSGDDNFTGSDNTTSPFSQEVKKASTSISLTSSANPSTQGQTVTFTATVSVQSPGSGSISGSVTFMDGTTTLGTGQINTSGTATYSTSSLALGSHSITAVYGGSGMLTGSTSSALTQNVDTDLSGFPKLSGGAYNLAGVNLAGAYLAGADLSGANISNTNMKGANLSGATLKGAALANTNLKGADLSGADLSNADLTGANLAGANLTGANLTNANLTQAALKGAIGLKTATLTGVTWSKTTCPDSTVSDQDGGTCLGHL